MLDTQAYSLFRLRKRDRIVGYMRYVSPTMHYYSTDLLWWAGEAIAYEHKDAYSTVKDKNSQYIFEWDLIKMTHKTSGEGMDALVVHSPFTSDYVAVQCESFQEIAQCDWGQYRIQRHSYLFVNPELMTAFKYNGYIPFDIN